MSLPTSIRLLDLEEGVKTIHNICQDIFTAPYTQFIMFFKTLQLLTEYPTLSLREITKLSLPRLKDEELLLSLYIAFRKAQLRPKDEAEVILRLSKLNSLTKTLSENIVEDVDVVLSELEKMKEY